MGHQIALTAGLDYAEGDIVATIDADLQDPPQVIAQMVTQIEAGYDLVHAQRISRSGETWSKRASASLFYRLIKLFCPTEIILDSGDFRIFTRQVLMVSRFFREPHRFLRGIFPQLGFRQCTIPYLREPRHTGETKFTFLKMLFFALNGIMNFTSLPLLLILAMGILLWIPGLIYAVFAIASYFMGEAIIQGWTSLTVLIIFLFGVVIFCIGLIGLYISKIYQSLQYRPLYWLSKAENIDLERHAAQGVESREKLLNYVSMRHRRSS